VTVWDEGTEPVQLDPAAPRTRTRLTGRGRVVIWTAGLIGLQALALGAIALSTSSAPVGLLGAAPVRPAPPQPLVLAPPSPARVPDPMARVGKLVVLVPSHETVGVAYHEASFAEAKRLRPLGRCIRNANRTKFDRPEPTEGPDYMVMSSRGRPRPATSAVDVAMRPGVSVLAPVSGTVMGVKRYYLYGRYRDYRVAIRPDGAPEFRVVLIHVDELTVRRGDKVTAGITVLAVPRMFPFHSQVNNYVRSSVPHVHLEVKAVGD
jgi:hypothetical protein